MFRETANTGATGIVCGKMATVSNSKVFKLLLNNKGGRGVKICFLFRSTISPTVKGFSYMALMTLRKLQKVFALNQIHNTKYNQDGSLFYRGEQYFSWTQSKDRDRRQHGWMCFPVLWAH